MRWKVWTIPLIAMTLMGGCPPLGSEALFRDVSRRPPDAAPDTLSALKADRRFGEWVLYQDRACDLFGCGS